MIEPPTPQPEPPKQPSILALIATVLAATLILSLGFCGYTMNHYSLQNVPDSAFLELVGVVGSAAGLVIVGIIALVRSGRQRP